VKRPHWASTSRFSYALSGMLALVAAAVVLARATKRYRLAAIAVRVAVMGGLTIEWFAAFVINVIEAGKHYIADELLSCPLDVGRIGFVGLADDHFLQHDAEDEPRMVGEPVVDLFALAALVGLLAFRACVRPLIVPIPVR